ncbi:hypothetical protein BKA62DRAFT_189859 [Auriculariales sp. MPI-PUGE-AT-0066]|nr:hypothetical protein BKA62DRAFT_189859 [Auriculariales sp. MPI-PUGE-AT-0066]
MHAAATAIVSPCGHDRRLRNLEMIAKPALPLHSQNRRRFYRDVQPRRRTNGGRFTTRCATRVGASAQDQRTRKLGDHFHDYRCALWTTASASESPSPALHTRAHVDDGDGSAHAICHVLSTVSPGCRLVLALENRTAHQCLAKARMSNIQQDSVPAASLTPDYTVVTSMLMQRPGETVLAPFRRRSGRHLHLKELAKKACALCDRSCHANK